MQLCHDALHFLSCAGIDNGSPGEASQAVLNNSQFLFLTPGLKNFPEKIAAIKTGNKLLRGPQRQLLHDIRANLVCGSSRKRYGLGPAQAVKGLSDPQIIGPEIMAPLGYAVSLIHSHHGNGVLPHCLNKKMISESFRGGIDQLYLACCDLLKGFLLLSQPHQAVNGSDRQVEHTE